MAHGKPDGIKIEFKILFLLVTCIFLLSQAMTVYFGFHILGARSFKFGLQLTFFTNMFAALVAMLFGFATLMRQGTWSRSLAPVCLIAAANIGMIALQLNLSSQTIPWVTYAVHASFSAIQIWGIHLIQTSHKSLKQNEVSGLNWVLILLCLVLAAWTYQTNAIFGVEVVSWKLSLLYSVLTLCFPFVSFGIQLQRLQKNLDFKPAAWYILPLSQLSNQSSDYRLLGIFLLNSFGQCLFLWLSSDKVLTDAANSSEYPLLWGILQCSSIACLFWSFRCWYLCNLIPRRINSPFFMDKMRVGKLFQRFLSPSHGNSRRNIGFRTAILTLDHDPNEECRHQLPAILYLARQTQCEQIIKSTFNDQILSMESQSSQLTIAIDNSRQSYSCTEALLILSIIHLDGLRLIENRLKLLASLFPLLDPDLAEVVQSKRLDNLFGKLSSFFYLDFNWVDQSLHTLGDEAYLDIRLENLNFHERQSVLSQLRSAQWLGNFVWVSESAYERLCIESPYMSQIIESITVKLETPVLRRATSSIHLIKFENLIPRLQRYYNLEFYRAKLAPLPVGELTNKMLINLRKSLDVAGGVQAIHYVLNELRNLDLVGFRAKDSALELLSQIVTKSREIYDNKLMHDAQRELVFHLCKSMVQEIGYPSQDIHESHLRKIEIRQYQHLLSYCADIRHIRCHEAWLLLASLSEKKLDGDFGAKVLDLISQAMQSTAHADDDLILCKMLETFFIVARVQYEHHAERVSQVLDGLSLTILRSTRCRDLILAFMDQKAALDKVLGHTLLISVDTLKVWEKEILLMEQDLSGHDHYRASLALRWRSFSQEQSMRIAG